MEMTAYTDLDLKIKFRLSVAVFGILFALITAFISCRKPGKIAGSVSPIEAIRYTEGNRSRKKNKKIRNRRSDSPYGSFQSGKKQKRGRCLLLFLLSLSIILLNSRGDPYREL